MTLGSQFRLVRNRSKGTKFTEHFIRHFKTNFPKSYLAKKSMTHCTSITFSVGLVQLYLSRRYYK